MGQIFTTTKSDGDGKYEFIIDEVTEPGFCIIKLKPISNIQQNIAFVHEQITKRQHNNEFKKSCDNTLSEQLVDNMSVKMKSVGAIVSGSSIRGTVFRVGNKYVMTALHVVNGITNPRGQNRIADNDWSKLDDPTVYISFAGSVMDLRSSISHIKSDVIYMNKQLDIAVLELKSSNDLPASLTLSKDMGQIKRVNLIGFGHPTDPRKQLDANCEAVHNVSQVMADINMYSNVLKSEYNELQDSDKFACHTWFEHGGSGAPAIVENEVTGILVKGIPYSYYNLRDTPLFTTTGIDKLPPQLMFELCIKTETIYKHMRNTHPQLAAHLFA